MLMFDRYDLVREEEGHEAMMAFARQNFSVYLAAMKAGRKRRGKNFAYRKEYLLEALKARMILRTSGKCNS